MVARRSFVLGVLGGATFGPALALGGDAAASAVAAGDGGGLERLARAIEKQLAHGKDDALPWHESILAPATARLVWRPGTVRARPGGEALRAAFDPATHWYFIALVAQGSDKPRYFGPLEETRPGVFVESFGAPAAGPVASAAPAASAPTASAAAGKGKGKGKAKKPRKA